MCCVDPRVLYLLCWWACNDLKVFFAVFFPKQGMQSLEYLLDVILWVEKKKQAILLPSAGGKINTTFPSGLRPLAILFPCQPLGFCWTLIRLSPGTLMNNKQTAQRFLYYTVQSRWLFTAKNVQPPSQKVGTSLEFNHNKVMENGNYI